MSPSASGSDVRPVQTAPRPAPAPGTWTDSVLATMSVRDRAAQMVWPSVVGDYVAADDERWRRVEQLIRDDRVGGFTVSVGSPLDIAAKTDAMQRVTRVPLLFAADFEAGTGFRARGGVFLPNAIELGGATWTPPLMALGAAGDSALAYELGRMTAIEGRALGVHIVYGPVLDVNNNANNPVINVRSFGEDPALVASLGAAFIRGVQDNGMVATGKHFPGHGDTEVNSHLALPVVNVPRSRLDSLELVPFRAAVRARVGAVMTFHGALPALDSSLAPATLSPGIIGGLLRGELGFEGVAITDAMDMRGVLDRYGAREATQRAVAAGADILIQPEDVRATIDAIVGGVTAGRYPESRVTDAARRILRLKGELGLMAPRAISADSVRAVVGTAVNRAFADTLASRGLTLVRDDRHLVPVRRGAGVLSVTAARRPDLTAGVHFDAALRAAGVAVRSAYVDSDAGDAGDYDAVLRTVADSDVVIVGSYVATRWDAASIAQSGAFVEFVRAASQRARAVVVVAFGNPYLLQQIPDVPAYLVAWSGAPATQRAAARALSGSARISGRLPISIPPVAVRGAGVQRAPAPLRD
jgi:beta-N-acetylhexosaminidase